MKHSRFTQNQAVDAEQIWAVLYAGSASRSLSAVGKMNANATSSSLCGNGGGGGMCLALDDIPEKAMADVSFFGVAFKQNRALVGGKMPVLDKHFLMVWYRWPLRQYLWHVERREEIRLYIFWPCRPALPSLSSNENDVRGERGSLLGRRTVHNQSRNGDRRLRPGTIKNETLDTPQSSDEKKPATERLLPFQEKLRPGTSISHPHALNLGFFPMRRRRLRSASRTSPVVPMLL